MCERTDLHMSQSTCGKQKKRATWQILKWKHIISCCNRFWDFSGAAVILVMWFSPLSTVYGFGKRSIARGIQEKAQQSPKPCFGFAGPSWACVASFSVYGESSRSGTYHRIFFFQILPLHDGVLRHCSLGRGRLWRLVLEKNKVTRKTLREFPNEVHSVCNWVTGRVL